MKPTQEIITGNKMIAEFMGLKPFMDGRYGWMYSNPIQENNSVFGHEGLKYHSSWDWLMPVLEKIKKVASKMYHDDLTEDFIVFEIDVWDNTITIIDEGTGTYPICSPIKKENLIEAIHEAVVEFIKWYNSITAVAVTPNEVQK